MRSLATIDSPEYRRRAMQCFSAAEDSSGEERETLLSMRAGLLQLADCQDRLNGKRGPVCA